ncbi:MAG: triphosphoribosyl-dephospho-CoA synthase, partial [bacterium]
MLARIAPAHAAEVYKAIAIARPGVMGRVDHDDIGGPPPTDLRAAMRAAAGRDQIARLWTEGFGPLFAGAVVDLAASLEAGMPVFEAIVDCHLRQLAREPDSL